MNSASLPALNQSKTLSASETTTLLGGCGAPAAGGIHSDLTTLRTAIDADRSALCVALLLQPDGTRFFCPECQHDGKPHTTGDLSVEAGFKCHRCGWHGDGLDLAQLVKGCSFPSAVEFVWRVYGITRTPPPARKAVKAHTTFDAAAKAACWAVGQSPGLEYIEIRRDKYRDAKSRDVAAVLRFNRADGAQDTDGKAVKSFRPIHAVPGGWVLGDPAGQWPLFMLPELLESKDTVFVCEGEGKTCAGAAIGLTCTTSAHGAKSAHKTDWTPLAGRDVVILPDNDPAGRGYAETVAGLVHAAGARSVKVLALPGLPAKGDLVEFVALLSGQTPEAIRAEVERLAESAPAWTPPKRDAPPELPNIESAALLDPVVAAKAGKPYAMTDLGNAERLVAYHGGAIRWDVSHKLWRAWDGRRWAVDDALEGQRRAADTARAIRKEAAAAPAGDGKRDIGRDLFNHAVKTESRDRLAAMLEVAKSRPGVAVAAAELDADPWLLNVQNGTIDLHTGTLRPHDRADLITKLAPIEYRPGCRCDRWEHFLADATGNDAALVEFLQRVAGYTLTGDTSEEKLFLVYGPEASGKTTFLESLRAILGEYARTIAADLLTRQRKNQGGGGASPELAGLAGARMAAGSEIEQGREMAEALAKNLTGDEFITARHLYAESFDFKPTFKLWLALNHCPKVSADDGAIWRRILRIGFEHTVTPERRDKTLKPYLRDPKGGAPAVLAWAVEGCLRWQRDGLRVPAAVARSTSAYRHESDPLATFFEDCLLFTSAAWTSWANLWAAYAAYAEEYGTPGKYRVAPKRLQERLKAHDCRGEHRYAGRGWAGVELRNDWKTPIKPIDHATHATYATTSVNFSTKSELAKVSQVTAWAAQVAWSPIPEAVELDFNAVEADPYESAERDAIREYDGAIEVAK